MAQRLPEHLKKYVVEQNYERYTSVDQACWRYILRQLKSFLAKNAHESYLEGLEKTGIEIDRIPKIEDISKKIECFGWRALPVSGFIPPAAFMEMQSLGILPIASDMRTLDHLMYTPAPDIVHEAAGHAPILIHPEFAQYLREYADVAKKAIISREDLDIYEAIRKLSDIKENPTSTAEQIHQAQTELETATKNISHISEAAQLGRMNWWTAEYGLIGSLENPKIFGAGLLSSVGESRWCLKPEVKKIPLTVACIEQTYDITEPQPQLFVTPDFATLKKVLNDLADTMAFRIGGLKGIQKIIQAQSVNTVELNSGIQISGKCIEFITKTGSDEIAYLRFEGPTQLAHAYQQIQGQGSDYHKHGFGTAVGILADQAGGNTNRQCLSLMSEGELKTCNIAVGQNCHLRFASGIEVKGLLKNITKQNQKNVIFSFTDCTVQYQGRILFQPDWGTYDMAVGSTVASVFGGPADRLSYGQTEDFIAARVPKIKYSEKELKLQEHYSKIRALRENQVDANTLQKELNQILETHLSLFPDDWLLVLEAIELAQSRLTDPTLALNLEKYLNQYIETHPDKKVVVEDGLSLANQL